MLVLALDTTTRRGSAALWRDHALLGCEMGDGALTYGQRLPGDLVRLLERHHLSLGDVELFAVAAGPGSFTGLRIGIATMQGLAMANGRHIVGISALDALNAAAGSALSPLTTARRGEAIATWIDAQRGEVFSALYQDGGLVDGPTAAHPGEVLAAWRDRGVRGPLTFVGDGALAYADLIRQTLPDAHVIDTVPPLAPAIARMAEEQAANGGGLTPDAIRPIYVRRPDVEIARDKKVQGSGFRVQGSESRTPKVQP